jgi:hypothetical protein
LYPAIRGIRRVELLESKKRAMSNSCKENVKRIANPFKETRKFSLINAANGQIASIHSREKK